MDTYLSNNTFKDENIPFVLGQKLDALNFQVTTDPSIMQMLSKSLYSNPLKTMMQEIMFNAWDSHKDKNITDKPIEIDITDSHIIFKDYGNGIPKKDIQDIYCTYGASTKKNQSNQTGGFGLGSKSPFAYTDNFIVTSCNNGYKTNYLVQRITEYSNTPTIQELNSVPTKETGLTVSIPRIVDTRTSTIVNYIKELLYLSGIHYTLKYSNSSTTNWAEEVPVGQFTLKPSSTPSIYAIYGGVKYEIQNNEYYEKEYNILSKVLLKESLFISFPPNTLTPLPNREKLNLK